MRTVAHLPGWLGAAQRSGALVGGRHLRHKFNPYTSPHCNCDSDPSEHAQPNGNGDSNRYSNGHGDVHAQTDRYSHRDGDVHAVRCQLLGSVGFDHGL